MDIMSKKIHLKSALSETSEEVKEEDTTFDMELEEEQQQSPRSLGDENDQDTQDQFISVDSDREYEYDVSPDCSSPSPKRFGPEGKKLYTCHECKYVTDRKNNLKRHIVTMHEKCTKVLECCDRVFLNKASLREHVVSCHKNGYDCRICGRNFCRKALLKRHITVHSGQKDFVCNVCGYATSHKSNLDRHKRRHIPKELRHRYPIEKNGRRRQEKERHYPRLPDFRKMPPFEASGTENHLPAALFGAPFGCFPSAMGDYSFLRNDFPRQIWKPPQKVPFKRWMLPDEEQEQDKAETASTSTSSSAGAYSFSHYLCHQQNPRDLPRDLQLKTNGERPGELDDLDSQQRASRKRLFPTLHKCKGCEMVFENQLQLSRHVDREHPAAGMVAPQRPLTLLIRPKAVLPWRFF